MNLVELLTGTAAVGLSVGRTFLSIFMNAKVKYYFTPPPVPDWQGEYNLATAIDGVGGKVVSIELMDYLPWPYGGCILDDEGSVLSRLVPQFTRSPLYPNSVQAESCPTLKENKRYWLVLFLYPYSALVYGMVRWF